MLSRVTYITYFYKPHLTEDAYTENGFNKSYIVAILEGPKCFKLRKQGLNSKSQNLYMHKYYKFKPFAGQYFFANIFLQNIFCHSISFSFFWPSIVDHLHGIRLSTSPKVVHFFGLNFTLFTFILKFPPENILSLNLFWHAV